MKHLLILWRWRGFILESVRRGFLTRYAGSSLGWLWHIVQGVAQIAIYAVVFSEIMRSRLPGSTDPLSYSIYLCAGVLPWQLLSELITQGSNLFIDNAGILKKSGFPRICLPVILLCNALLNFLIIFGIFCAWLLITDHLPTSFVQVIGPLLLIAGLGLAIGILLGVLNVFLRDLGQVVVMVLPFWFWLTPIVWPLEAVPPLLRSWLVFNPLTPIVEALHSAFLGTPPVAFQALLYPMASISIFGTLAIVAFVRLKRYLVDEL